MCFFFFFFFNDTATTEIYTLSLHDALPIWPGGRQRPGHRGERHPREGRLVQRRSRLPGVRPRHREPAGADRALGRLPPPDRKSTRLNSSHANISYAVFCLKKKKKNKNN